MTDDLSPQESARLAELRHALQGEFQASLDASPRKSAIKDIEDLKPDALAALQHVMRFSQNEPLRAKVAMWTYERLITASREDADELTKLFEGMATATTPAATS
jgi:hypothetical protein